MINLNKETQTSDKYTLGEEDNKLNLNKETQTTDKYTLGEDNI